MSLDKEIKQKIDSARHEAVLNIVYTANFLDKISRSFFSDFDITEAQYNVMVIIKLEKRRLTQVEISERMVSSRANITSLIDKLQKKGYVRRLAVAKDRRVHQIELTSQGIMKLDEVEPQYIKIVEQNMRRVSLAESRDLNHLLVKIRKSFKSIEGV
ncbi:MAG: MarR family transcriptional regulator [Candidatus Omnitrophica bacterium]|nr:MarR family transcriptional regulator [Candidatus Omnitrophota bacterium]